MKRRGSEEDLSKVQDEIDGLRDEIRRLRGQRGPAPRRKADEEEEPSTPPPRLNWQEDFSEILGGDDEGKRTVEDYEGDLINGLVGSVEEPSLYLLVATRDTFGQGGCSKCLPKFNSTAMWIATLFATLSFITIVLPLCLLPNVAKRVPFFNFETPGVETADEERGRAHKTFLKFTSAFLLFFLLYTSLSVLDEVKTFRFFLLADLGGKKEEPPPPQEKTSIVRHSTSSVGAAALSIFTEKPPLARWLVMLGIISKLVSLFTVFQLTYLIFRIDFTPASMILNSVALQFILDADRVLVNALKNQPSLRRFYARAVEQLRQRADEVVLGDPDTVRAICEPMMLGVAELVTISLSNDALDAMTQTVKKTASSVTTAAAATTARKSTLSSSSLDAGGEDDEEAAERKSDEEEEEEVDYNRLNKERCCARSELLHRSITTFVYFYGGVMVAFQVIGSIVCGSTDVCRILHLQ